MPPFDDDLQLGELALEAVHLGVPEPRDLAIVLGREAFQDGVTRVHDEGPAIRASRDRLDETAHEVVVLRAIDAEPVLDRHRDRHRVLHRLHAVGHQLRLGHEAGAERAALHALGRAAAVQVDLVVAPALAQLRAGGEVGRLAAAELERDRVLRGVEVEVPRDVAVEERAGGDHLGVDDRVRRQLPEEDSGSAGPTSPSSARCRGDARAWCALSPSLTARPPGLCSARPRPPHVRPHRPQRHGRHRGRHVRGRHRRRGRTHRRDRQGPRARDAATSTRAASSCCRAASTATATSSSSPGTGMMCADDFYTGTVAAAFGGTTTIIPFAAQHRGNSIVAVVDDYARRARREGGDRLRLPPHHRRPERQGAERGAAGGDQGAASRRSRST